jgi:hypothetical protein
VTELKTCVNHFGKLTPTKIRLKKFAKAKHTSLFRQRVKKFKCAVVCRMREQTANL